MAKPHTEWTVLPHGRLTRLDDNILTVTGLLKMPVGEVERRMTAVRLRDGGMVVFSVIALDEPEMAALEAFGTPTFMVVPNEIHRMDAKVWKQRYPSITVVAPAGAHEEVSEIVPVDATDIDFGDPAVRFVTVPGTAEREAALIIENDAGTTLVLNDLIFNLANRPGFGGWLLKLAGVTGTEPHVPAMIKMLQVKDEKALQEQLERWAALPNLRRIVVSHGNIISREPSPLLLRIAHELAA